MRSLRFARGLSMPLDAVTNTFANLGKRGTGKTNAAMLMFEGMVRAGLAAIWIDPVSVAWGIRFSRDGTSPGLPVLIFGGEHGDVPIEETAGATIADFIIETGTPCVLDLGELSKSAQRRFMTDFCERLYQGKNKSREPLHVFIDEADAYIPQHFAHDGARLVGAINDIVRRGRSRGLGVTLISQRPAVLNKDVLTQVEVMCAFRMTGPQDRDAIAQWIKYNADMDQKAALASLAELADGECWVWSPSWLKKFERVKVYLRDTFDSATTPTARTIVPKSKNAAPVDLDALKTRIQDTIEKAKQENPKLLRQRVAELEKQIRTAKPVETQTEPEVITQQIEVPVLSKSEAKQLARAVDAIVKVSEKFQMLADALTAKFDTIHQKLSIPVTIVAPSAPTKKKLVLSKSILDTKTKIVGDGSGTPMPIGEKKILTAVAQLGGADRVQLSAVTGMKPSTRNTYIQRLAQKGYLIADRTSDSVSVTQEGITALGSFEQLPTGHELRDYWKAKLPSGESAVFAVLCDAYPEPLTREEVTEKTGYKPSTRNTYIQRLAQRKIVDTSSDPEIRASEFLF